MLKIELYHPIKKEEWDTFVTNCKNGTFLFHRDFMDYHQDRFEDFSLMIYNNEKLVALLPANKVNNTVFSHQGLTYGGLIFKSKLKFRGALDIFRNLLEFLHKQKIDTIDLKLMPSIYSTQPNDELVYLMFLAKAELIRRDALSVLNLKSQPKRSKDRIDGYKRGVKNQLVVKEVDDFDTFWNIILMKNLESKHGVAPVHKLNEITNLKKKFPKNIRQFNVYKNDVIVAGTTVFETTNVAHSQYISGNSDKNILGSLDFLHIHLIDNVFDHKAYFDFGISNENNGLNVNEGLQYWKEGFGARTITQDFYQLKTEHFKLLDNVMI